MKNVAIRNDFHNSSTRLRVRLVWHIRGTATIYPSPTQIRRARRQLCGISGCECSQYACGARGPQKFGDNRLEIDESSLYERSA